MGTARTWMAAALALAATALPGRADDTLFQYGTLDGLMAGVYDGTLTTGELPAHGDLGLGTFNGLDGEMVVVDGTVYRVDHTGRVTVPDGATPTPFAAVTPFEAEQVFAIGGGLDMAGLAALLDSRLADRNTPVAVRIDGRFAALTVRAPQRQEKPYVGLVEALKSQAVFEHTDVEGTMVGFWFPGWLDGVNVAAWHLHVVSADRTVGGHVLGLTTAEATVALDRSPDLRLVLPQTPEFAAAAIADR